METKGMSDFLGDVDFELYRKLIYDESGITFSTTNRSILESRLKERLREKKLESLKDYFSLITRDKEELKTLLDSVTTNLTRFFRNQAHFDAIEKYVVPELIKLRGPSGERKLRFWSAGCSTGEEPYTSGDAAQGNTAARLEFRDRGERHLAQVPHGGQGGLLRRRADTGHPRVLPAQVLRPQARRLPAQGRDQEADVRFDYHNLKNDSGLRGLDVVFCRNVLIYFDEAAQKAAIERFWEAMAPKSFLFIGHSESLFGMNTKFEFVKTDWATFYRKNV
jgi:chemotaxis protein methyltransferase CheR